MFVKINVSRYDIAHGKMNKAHACPIARAVKKLLQPRYRDSVQVNDEITLEAPDAVYGKAAVRSAVRKGNFREVDVVIPGKAKEFIAHYDNGDKVEPFSFYVNLPASVLRHKRVV